MKEEKKQVTDDIRALPLELFERMSRRMKMRIRFQDRRSHTGVMRGDVFGEIKWRWYQPLY